MSLKQTRFYNIVRSFLAIPLRLFFLFLLLGGLINIPFYVVDKVLAYFTDPINQKIVSLKMRHDQMQDEWQVSKERFLALPNLHFEEKKELEVIEKQIVEQELELKKEQQHLQERLDQYDFYANVVKGFSFFIWFAWLLFWFAI